jgi:hypothetical protein
MNGNEESCLRWNASFKVAGSNLASPITTQQMGLQQSWRHSVNRNLAYNLRSVWIAWVLERPVCQVWQVNGYVVPFYNAGT